MERKKAPSRETTPSSNPTVGKPTGFGWVSQLSFRSIYAQLLVSFVLTVLLSAIIINAVSAVLSFQSGQQQLYDQLESVATLKTSEIGTWMTTLQHVLNATLRDRDLVESVSPMLQQQLAPADLKTAHDRLQEDWRQTVAKAGLFDGMFLMDLQGQIVLSTDAAEEGRDVSSEGYYLQGVQKDYITPPFKYSPQDLQLSVVVVHPIVTDQGLLGVIAGRASINTLTTIMQERTGLGETGETYLVGADSTALTALRDGRQGVEVQTTGTQDAINNQVSGFGLYPDYLSVPVVGIYHWLPDLQVALLAEKDQAEAFSAIYTTLGINIGVSLAAVLLALIVAFLVTRSIATPLADLAEAATEIAAGNLERTTEVKRSDEIGALAAAFNNMTVQLRNMIATLEQRVADRTKALATSTEVSRRLSTILNQKELVTEVVNQVTNAFGYYHTQIYFYDDVRENLVMAGGTGEAGQKMLAQFHKVAKGRGLVGRAAESNQAVLVSETAKNAEWLPNVLLPDTESEAAIPISIGDQVLGVLDVQHNIPNGLQQEDVDSLQSIANQVAVAIQNIRQYENTQKIAADMGVVASVGIATSTITDAGHLLQEVVELSKKSFDLYHAHIYLLDEAGDTLELAAGAGEVGKQMVSEKRSIPLDREQSLVARAARTREGVVVNDVTLAPDFLPNPLLPDTRSEMAVPMLVAGKAIGVLDVQSETANRFTAVDVSIQTTLASQVAVALQNARSFSQTQRQAQREAMVNLITQKIQGTTSIEAALRMTARELGHALGMRSTLVSLDPSAVADESKAVDNE